MDYEGRGGDTAGDPHKSIKVLGMIMSTAKREKGEMEKSSCWHNILIICKHVARRRHLSKRHNVIFQNGTMPVKNIHFYS